MQWSLPPVYQCVCEQMDAGLCFERSSDLEMCFMCSPTIAQRTFITKCLSPVWTVRKIPISKNRTSLPAQRSLMWFTHKQNDMWQQSAVNKGLVVVIMPQAELDGCFYAGSVCLKSSHTSGVSHVMECGLFFFWFIFFSSSQPDKISWSCWTHWTKKSPSSENVMP